MCKLNTIWPVFVYCFSWVFTVYVSRKFQHCCQELVLVSLNIPYSPQTHASISKYRYVLTWIGVSDSELHLITVSACMCAISCNQSLISHMRPARVKFQGLIDLRLIVVSFIVGVQLFYCIIRYSLHYCELSSELRLWWRILCLFMWFLFLD